MIRTGGAAKRLGGKVEEGAEKRLGDEKLKHEGKADQAEGKARNIVGGIKDMLKGT